MVVVKKGEERKEWPGAEFVCTGRHGLGGGCKAVLFVSKSDLYWGRRYLGAGLGSGYDALCFSCCLCGVVTYVSVPSWVNKTIERRKS